MRLQLAALHSEQGRGHGGRLRLRLRLRLGDSGQLARLLGRLDAVPAWSVRAGPDGVAAAG